MAKLFEDTTQPRPPTAETAGRAVGVAVNANVWGTYDYIYPQALGEPTIGQRVRVPFGRGNRPLTAIIVDTRRPPGRPRLKTVAEVIDAESRFDSVLWKLGEWIHRYYMTPLGATLSAMIPSSVGRRPPKTERVVFLAKGRSDWPRALGPRQRRVLDELYEARKQGVEPLPLEMLRSQSGASADSIRRLSRRELIRLETRPVSLDALGEPPESDPFALNADQAHVLGKLEEKLRAGFSTTLLYGVTGSGKTEIYIRAIRRIAEAGAQSIVLVPEIALATQTLQRLIKRLPRVAVLHSGLSDAQRAFYYEKIASGEAAVVVGPRSAVFAPARKLGLIIVDEEHEPTYKQDTAPRYHARDVAVMRASFSNVPVILGTATPSLETFHNVQIGRYEMLRLPHRVRNLPMPKLKVVPLRQEMSAAGPMELLGKTLTNRIAAALDRSEQIILLMNRRGYASYVFCPSCRWLMCCENCTRTMVFHQAVQMAMCHYCQRTEMLPEACPACDHKLLLFGFGIQRTESEIARKFPAARFARMDSDTMASPAQFRKVFDAFAAGELDMLLGTQMVAKGLDFPRVSLVGIVSADTSLAIPDFRASERTFQLVVQVAGRAGRADLPGEVIVQTLHADEPAIRFAINHDYDGFALWELPQRQSTDLPPFSRIVRFLVRHSSVDKAERGIEELGHKLRQLTAGQDFTMVGPQPAGVRKIRNQFRFHILLTAPRAGMIQRLVYPQIELLAKDLPGELVIDVDPTVLL